MALNSPSASDSSVVELPIWVPPIMTTHSSSPGIPLEFSRCPWSSSTSLSVAMTAIERPRTKAWSFTPMERMLSYSSSCSSFRVLDRLAANSSLKPPPL